MSDRQRLFHHLDALAASGHPDGAADGGAPLPALRQMLLRLDETLMPRHLRFLGVTGSLEVHVAARRVQSVAKFSGAVDAVATDWIGTELQSVSHTEPLAKLLRNFCENAGEIRVSSQPVDGGGGSPDSGCSAEAIAQALGIALYPAAAGPSGGVLDRLLGQLDSEGMTWVRSKGDGSDLTSSDPGQLGFPGKEALEALDGYLIHAPGDEGRLGCAVFRGNGPGARIFIRQNDDRALIRVPAQTTANILTAWRAACCARNV